MAGAASARVRGRGLLVALPLALLTLLGAAPAAGAQGLPGVQVPPVEVPSVPVPVPTPSLPDAGAVVDTVTGGGALPGQVGGAVEEAAGVVTGPAEGVAGDPGGAPGSSEVAPQAALPTGSSGAPAGEEAFGSAALGPGASVVGPSAAAPPRSPLAVAAARERRRRAAHERRLRRAVPRLEGCFYVLSELERRVLSLRAGTRGEPRSRREVARRLDMDATQVRRAERRGLRALRQADRETGCSSAQSPVAGGIGYGAGTGASGNAAALFGPPAKLATPEGDGAGRRGERRAKLERSGGGAVAGERASGPGATPGSIRPAPGAVRTATDEGPPGPLLVLLGLLLVSALALLALLRSRRPAGGRPLPDAGALPPVGAAPAQAPPPAPPTPAPPAAPAKPARSRSERRPEPPPTPSRWEEGPWTITPEGRLVALSDEADASPPPPPPGSKPEPPSSS